MSDLVDCIGCGVFVDGGVVTLVEGGVVAFAVCCGASTLVEDGVVAFGFDCGASTLVEGGVDCGASTLVEDGVDAFAACVVVVITPVVKRPSAKLVLAIIVIFIVVCSIRNY